MALFNYANREITAKIVYYGPGVCGKTTSLQYIHERIAPAQRGRLLSLATETDRTIFFDLLPLKLGEIRNFKLRFQLYTVPGQPKYNKTRKLVLQGADAIVFVADSFVEKRDENIDSFQNLQQNLKEQGKKLEDLPLVYAYNKRDLDQTLSIEELNQDLNFKNLPYFPAIATQGVGVMETLEAISKLALQDIEQRLSATTTAEIAEPEPEDELEGMDLLDLSGEGELEDTSFSLSTEELDSLDLESDLDLLGTEEKPLESRPIGYDNNIAVEEFEIQPENVAHTGTLQESEFFDLKEIEEQALRELDAFIQGDMNEEPLTFEALDSGVQAAASEQSEEDLFADDDQDNVLDFSFDDTDAAPADGGLDFSFSAAGGASQTEEMFDDTDDGGMDFSFSAAGGASSIEIGTEEEDILETQEFPGAETDSLLEFSLDEESQQPEPEAPFSQESAPAGDLGPFELSADELDLSFNEKETGEEEEAFPSFALPEDEGAQGELPPLMAEEDEDLLEFTLDEEGEATQEPVGGGANSDIESLELSEDELNLTFGDEVPEETIPPGMGFEASGEAASEPYDFRITDSVRFEMQHSEEISSVTPFEKQLDELSEDMFTAEGESSREEFQPETSGAEEQEQFQAIAEESTRLIVLAKYFYQQGEIARGRQAVKQHIQAVMMYYIAIETALKAIALKYETCNPAIASLKIILDSIEEETGKTISGKKSIMDNIVKLKDDVQLEVIYPDQDSCELASRICDRFLSSLAQDFLSIDFTDLSPILPEPPENA